MRLLACLSTLAAATLVSSISLDFGGSQNPIIQDDKVTVPGENPLDFCTDPKDYILTVDYVNLTPNPPRPYEFPAGYTPRSMEADRSSGEKLVIEANGTFSQDIEPGATVFLQVKYGLITLIKQEADLCDNLPKIDMECPVKKGVLTIKKEVDIPKQVPPGKYTVLADVNTVDKEKITCMESVVYFSKQ
ncbi:Phosphatidylglycerol/phosphatidylinositol transfer protein [Cyphellophora attinorum]|uniref:Phosphatidylglycerol/phosphatidylinositol transfer protein n=1 Tax=Cyphellophora attinorum TaxID=1664694 RepID=A0A0N0NQH4_9EURO|nr:Phosphatidylglycerol/phosphatidylinositol transfer protein [Phialophora attinorum]KPI43911.1 Phosphatidylglycerol/phosphatidylinositol transfer protein [Phialophora attinorum]